MESGYFRLIGFPSGGSGLHGSAIKRVNKKFINYKITYMDYATVILYHKLLTL